MDVKRILSFSVGPIIGSFLGLITVPLLSWIYNQEIIGMFAIIQVVISFTLLVYSIGLDQSYVREHHESKNKNELFFSAFYPGFSFLVLTSIIIFIFKVDLSHFLFEINSIYISLLVVIISVCSFISKFFMLTLRMENKGLSYSICQITPKITFVLLLLAIYFLGTEAKFSELVTIYTFSLAIALIVVISLTIKTWIGISFENVLSTTKLKSMMKFGGPLIFSGISFWLLTSADRVLLSKLSNFSELGLYSVSLSFASVATIFQVVFSTIWAPSVYKWAYENEGNELIVKTRDMVLLVISVMFCMAGMLSWIITYILPPEYNSVQYIVLGCLVYPLFYTLSECTVVGINIQRKTIYSLISTSLAMLVNLVFNYFLIPSYGASGAAASTAISFYVFLILRTEFSIFLWKDMPRKRMYFLCSLILFGVVTTCLQKEDVQSIFFYYWGLLLIFCFGFFRVEIKAMTNILVKKFK